MNRLKHESTTMKKERLKTLLQIHLRQINARINSWLFVERIFLLIGVLAIIFGLWYFLLMLPVQQSKINVQSVMNRHTRELQSLKSRVQRVKEQIQVLEKADQKKAINLKSRLNQVEAQLAKAKKKLYSGEEIANILRKNMGNNQLALVSLNSSPERTVVRGTAVAPEELVQQDIEFVFQGDFLATLQYFTLLEKKDAQLFWNGLDYLVKAYPNAEVKVNLNILNQKKMTLVSTKQLAARQTQSSTVNTFTQTSKPAVVTNVNKETRS